MAQKKIYQDKVTRTQVELDPNAPETTRRLNAGEIVDTSGQTAQERGQQAGGRSTERR